MVKYHGYHSLAAKVPRPKLRNLLSCNRVLSPYMVKNLVAPDFESEIQKGRTSLRATAKILRIPGHGFLADRLPHQIHRRIHLELLEISPLSTKL